MIDHEHLAQEFEGHRPRLRAVAYRMLGSPSEAEDAVQEAWLRLARSDAAGLQNLGGWLTTVVARVCLDLLRARTVHAEEPLDAHGPEPVVTRDDEGGPERDALLADSVSLALLVVLEKLSPAERVSFVLHDTFAVPFEEVARILGRSVAGVRQLASRARRRVQGAAADGDADPARQREVVNAFLTAARGGDVAALLAVLDPDVVLRTDRGAEPPGTWHEVRGAESIARQAVMFSRVAGSATPVRVNGQVGVVGWLPDGRPMSVMGFTVRGGRIVQIAVLSDPARLARLGLEGLRGPRRRVDHAEGH